MTELGYSLNADDEEGVKDSSHITELDNWKDSCIIYWKREQVRWMESKLSMIGTEFEISV